MKKTKKRKKKIIKKKKHTKKKLCRRHAARAARSAVTCCPSPLRGRARARASERASERAGERYARLRAISVVVAAPRFCPRARFFFLLRVFFDLFLRCFFFFVILLRFVSNLAPNVAIISRLCWTNLRFFLFRIFGIFEFFVFVFLVQDSLGS